MSKLSNLLFYTVLATGLLGAILVIVGLYFWGAVMALVTILVALAHRSLVEREWPEEQ